MRPRPTEKQLAKIPGLYSTEKIPCKDKVIHAHFFVGSCDWWIAEYDPKERLCWGYACLGDPQCAEWGYVSLDELETVRVSNIFHVEYDRHWTPVKASEISGILHK